MNFNFDRMTTLAGIETEDQKLLNEDAKTKSARLNESDEQRIREIIREELKSALGDIINDKQEQKDFNNARETKSLAHAIQFANASKYGKIHPAPAPNSTSQRAAGSLGFVGGLGFH